MVDWTEVRRRIRAAREDSEMGIKEFAKAVGVHVTTVYRWERMEGEAGPVDNTLPSIESMHRIATVTGKSMTWLMGGKAA